jgi:hypothetical protein
VIHRSTDLPFKLAEEDEPGAMRFQDFLIDRIGDRRRIERLTVFLHQWEIQSDELETRGPTAAEYAKRWGVPPASAYRLYAEFQAVFPTETDPQRLLSRLWDGMKGPGLRHLFSVMVVQEMEGAR